jgi:hypothetical protein
MGQPSLFSRLVYSFLDFAVCFVDFASQTASLKTIGKTSMIRLFKGLIILGVLLCFTLGAFAVSFAAHDSAPPWPLVTVGLQRLPAKDATQLTPHALRFGIGSDISEVPNPSRPDLQDVRSAHTSLVEPISALSKTSIHTAKVSLQIFELVLLL